MINVCHHALLFLLLYMFSYALVTCLFFIGLSIGETFITVYVRSR